MILTFDDGPSEWTPQILDLLAAHSTRATFFLIGANIAGREHTVRRIADEGHELGNHTFTHPRMTDLSDQDARRELERTQDAIYEAAGIDAALWRAPGMRVDERILALASAVGLTHVGVTVSPPDWRLMAVQIARSVSGDLTEDSIVGLHDGIPPGGGSGYADRVQTAAALEILLGSLFLA